MTSQIEKITFIFSQTITEFKLISCLKKIALYFVIFFLHLCKHLNIEIYIKITLFILHNKIE